MIIRLFCFDLQNNLLITSCKNWGIQGNSAKSAINPMSSFGLIEENMELSYIDKAVPNHSKNLALFANKKKLA